MVIVITVRYKFAADGHPGPGALDEQLDERFTPTLLFSCPSGGLSVQSKQQILRHGFLRVFPVSL
eukprot:4682249-Amphidinium_carterae.1